MKIKVRENVLGSQIKIADTPLSRIVGLMFKKQMVGFDGLLINPCNSIHTFFCRYNLDILFLDKNMKIIKIIRNLKPWRITWIYFKACQVLELNGGSLSEEIKEGDTLEVICIN